jgi:hypothetical protein
MKVLSSIQKLRVVAAFLVISVGINLTYFASKRLIKSVDDLDVYTVLAEKAFTAQADFDTAIWANMLADDVVFSFSDDTQTVQKSIVGKNSVLKYWQILRGRTGIKSIRLSGFNHVPHCSTEKMKVSGLAGMHVFSLINSAWHLENGQTAAITLNFYCHFNTDKLIDRYFVYYDRMPLKILYNQSKIKYSTINNCTKSNTVF